MKKIKSVLLLGSGALKIGEAGEFDYSGSQAIKALKEEQVRIILVNPNVATIQTSDGLADVVYFLPVQASFVERIISKEKPDGILLSFGGQTALNCGLDLYKQGILKRYKVEILGTPIEAIHATEDRQIFAKRLQKIGLSPARGKIVTRVENGLSWAKELGYPVMIRTGFALGGTGSGVAVNEKQLTGILTRALATSKQVIIEESLTGWKEIEYEVVRDRVGNSITVCNMENLDPVGIHTGESIVVAPSQTLSNEEYYMLRQHSLDVIADLGIVGECNIQFALHPQTSAVRVIEVNARLSRSSALASKATGYPLAYIAAKLALGNTLPHLRNKVTGITSAFFEPALDYIVVKMPRWDLDKYEKVVSEIGSEMKSVGEVMAIGRSFEEAIQKASRMLTDGYEGVIDKRYGNYTLSQLRNRLRSPDTLRLFTICSALRAGMTVREIHTRTGIDNWFLYKLSAIVTMFKKLDTAKAPSAALIRQAKEMGFSDIQIGTILHRTPQYIRKLRTRWDISPKVKRIDTTAGEFPAITNYCYLTYNAQGNDAVQTDIREKVIVLGCGPYAIGTSVEFDWCAVNTVQTLKKLNRQSVIINCNPETVSTDFDTADTLYFEELTLERVLDIVEIESAPVIVSVGGQIPNSLTPLLAKAGVPILGTSPDSIQRAEIRDTFSAILDSLRIAQPPWGRAKSTDQAVRIGRNVGYPLLVRPSFVLSGKGMHIVENELQLIQFMSKYPVELTRYPLVLTRFLPDAIECDFDGVAYQGRICLWALSEHIEHGGVHSGDSTLMLPASDISDDRKAELKKIASKIALELFITGPFNIQFLLINGSTLVIECNLRASRSVPFVSKTLQTNFIEAATLAQLGIMPQYKERIPQSFVALKVPQFSFSKLRGSDPVLRVEMRSTGEVCAMGPTIDEALLTALAATGIGKPRTHAVLVSLGGARAKLDLVDSCRLLVRNDYTLYGTTGTALFLTEHNIPCKRVGKIHEESNSSAIDLIRDKKVDFAVVIPQGYGQMYDDRLTSNESDGYILRRASIDSGIPIFSNTQTSRAYIKAVVGVDFEDLPVLSWQEYNV